jgi:hypothetical protein
MAATLPAKAAEEIGSYNEAISRLQQEQEQALAENEKWIERESGACDYAEEMDRADKEWLRREHKANQQALQLLRQLIPMEMVQGGRMTEKGLADAYVAQARKVAGAECKAVMSLELANELYSNKLLHWACTHKEDIAKANFLVGPTKPCFEGIEKLDVVELRAIAACLPDRFELDSDGKKREWRARFMTKAKAMVARQNGELVAGSWDAKQNARKMVPMPPLGPSERRRDVYFYRKHRDMVTRKREYSRKATTLASKKQRLSQLEESVAANKREYQVILSESRDPAFREQICVETLSRAKKLALEAVKTAESQKRVLGSDIIAMEGTIKSAYYSEEEFSSHFAAVEAYLEQEGKAEAWKKAPGGSGSASGGGDGRVPIRGFFPANPAIAKSERAIVKTFSVEEEAEKRREEMDFLQSSKKSARKQQEQEQEQDKGHGAQTPAHNEAASTAAYASTGGEAETGAAEAEEEEEEEGDDEGCFFKHATSPARGADRDDVSLMGHGAFTDTAPAPAGARKGVSFALAPATPAAARGGPSVLSNLDPAMLATLNNALSASAKKAQARQPTPLGNRDRAGHTPGPNANVKAKANANANSPPREARPSGVSMSTPIRNLSSALGAVEQALSAEKPPGSGAKPVQTKSKLLARLLGQGEGVDGDKENSGGANAMPKAARPPSFLDSIKGAGALRARGGDSAVKPSPARAPTAPSFLDAIKARGKVE